MSSFQDFPDRHHLEAIKKALWSGKPYGKAAVMVGAGFSRNARPKRAGARPFPTWVELTGFMYDDLYPARPTESPPDRAKAKAAATAGLGALRLASEYEADFGRQKLHELLLRSIPYSDYGPGKLHELLLELPWSDVFTTNYDTLLEDSQDSIAYWNYGLIRAVEDISQCKRPRIVKLHGSFPSNRPLIITEEDYRTYPSRFAAFVNLVQEALMENTFCMIGFSGDDPNFLQWIGWVRDNLKENMPRLYLVGLLSLSTAARRLLESRKVIPIDLSPLFPVIRYPDAAQRHQKALRLFLEELHAGRPPDALGWLVVKSGVDLTGPKGPATAADLEAVLSMWKEQRISYPGWVVCPRANRQSLWFLTQGWIGPISSQVNTLAPPKNILILRELNWRLETALVPLPGIEKHITDVVELFNPFPGLAELEGATFKRDKSDFSHEEWSQIEEAWLELVFALVRKARENLDEATFRRWIETVRQVIEHKSAWEPRFCYELCLWHLYRLDVVALMGSLKDWRYEHDPPFWKVRRAAIMSEIGLTSEAVAVASDALKTIQHSVRSDIDDYPLLSQEGWTMLLVSHLEAAQVFDQAGKGGLYRQRWAELDAFRCNPWPDIESIKASLDQEPPVRPSEKEEKHIEGVRRTVYHLTTPSTFERRLPAFAFLRLLEEGALPVRMDFFTVAGDATINAAKWAHAFSTMMAISFMMRNADPQTLEQWLDRVRAATLRQEDIEKLGGMLTQVLRHALSELEGGREAQSPTMQRFHKRWAIAALFFLQRLAFRFDTEDRLLLFDLVTGLYRHRLFTKDLAGRAWLKKVIAELMRSMTTEEIVSRLPTLLGLPIPEQDDFRIVQPEDWVEPFKYIDFEPGFRLNSASDASTWQTAIQKLLRTARDGSTICRTGAIWRLNGLHATGALTAEQVEAFGSAIWAQVDDDSGLPANTLFASHSFLLLPEPTPGQAKEKFREWVLRLSFPRINVEPNSAGYPPVVTDTNHETIADTLMKGTFCLLPSDPAANERLVDWTLKEASIILQKSAAWWDDNKDKLKYQIVQDKPLVADGLRKAFSNIVPLLARTVFPCMGEADEDAKRLGLRLLAEMEQEGFCVNVAEPASLLVDPSRYDQVSQKLRRELVSSGEERVKEAVEAVFYWLVLALRKSVARPPDDLTNELVNIVVSRRNPGLKHAMVRITNLIERCPDELNGDQLDLLSVGLDYLKTETEIPVDIEEYRKKVPSPTIPLEERPEHMKLAAALAYTICEQLKETGADIPQVLNEWRAICQSSVFPEVRGAWPS